MDNIKELLDTFAGEEESPVEEVVEANPYDAALMDIAAKLDRLIEIVTEDKKVEDKIDRKENEIEKEGEDE